MRVKAFVHALVTDQVLSGWDENGGQYSTVVLGKRSFSKVLDLSAQPSDTPAVRLSINDRSYMTTAKPIWSDVDQEWQLETTLPGDDNQPLSDCTSDASWIEIESSLKATS